MAAKTLAGSAGHRGCSRSHIRGCRCACIRGCSRSYSRPYGRPHRVMGQLAGL